MDKCPLCEKEYSVKMTPKMTEWYHRQSCEALTDERRKELDERDRVNLEKWLNESKKKPTNAT